MSTLTPQLPAQRHTQSVAISSSAASSRNPQNPLFYNKQSIGNNLQPAAKHRQPTTPPRTPQKMAGGEQGRIEALSTAPESATKPKSRGKNRAKNTITTPAGPRADRGTPPVRSVQSVGQSKPISTPNAAAYAGPTFHASPAPSALPLPSFYSKSVPESPSIKVSDPRADEGNSSAGDSPTPAIVKPLVPEPRREESPLDFFFNADRQEKARARNANSASLPFQSPTDSPTNGYTTPLQNAQSRSRSSHFSGGSASSMFAMELDGTPGKPYGPAFSTPYNERINAARSTPSPLSSPPSITAEQQKTTDRSEALKSFLFSGQSPASSNRRSNEVPYSGQKPPTPSHNGQRATLPAPSNNAYGSPQSRHTTFPFINDGIGGTAGGMRNTPRSSGLRQEVTPTKTPTPERMDRSFQSPQTPSRNVKENSLSSPNMLGTNFNPRQASSDVVVPPSVTSSYLHNSDIRSMEDSLRRILKLEPAGSSGISNTGIPAAAVPVPVYGGGGPTPFGGINGVM